MSRTLLSFRSILPIACAMTLALTPLVHAAGVPRLDHIIVVVMENKNYDQARTARYIASFMTVGSWFSNYHAVTHPSQPNYLALWSGGTQGVLDNKCPARGTPFMTENLGHACEAAGTTWRSYAEDLPVAGSSDCTAKRDLYARKHNPWTNFGNLNHQNERPYTDLAADIAGGRLPALAFVIPNQCDDMHSCPLEKGDAWLASNLPAMLRAVGPRGIVVLTWDEDDDGPGNQILTVIAGAPAKQGYVSSRRVTHYTLLRTICEALRLPAFGAAGSEAPITDVWTEAGSAPITSAEGLRPSEATQQAHPGRLIGPAAPGPSVESHPSSQEAPAERSPGIEAESRAATSVEPQEGKGQGVRSEHHHRHHDHQTEHTMMGDPGGRERTADEAEQAEHHEHHRSYHSHVGDESAAVGSGESRKSGDDEVREKHEHQSPHHHHHHGASI